MTKPTGSLGRHVVHSSAWLCGRHLVTNLFSVFVTALLARKLAPGDFGLIALASVILGLLTTLGPIGVADYIIYDREAGREERVHAAFWLNIALTLAAVGVCSALVPLVTVFYEMPGLQTILYLLLVQFAVGQLAGVPDALLRRALDFKRLALRETVFEILKGAGMVAMALNGFGIWSLIVPSLLLTPLRVIVAFKLAGWLPTLALRRSLWPVIFRYSFHTTGAGLVNLLANEGDTLIIGKRLGATDLGFYNQAWISANLVNRNVTGVVAKVAMPALSAVSRDMNRLRAGLNRMMRLLASTSCPLLIGLFVVADLFVLTFYGPKWQPTILPLRILIVFALRQTVGSPASVIYNVLGRPDIPFKSGLAFLPFYGVSIWLGSHYGIVGVAVGVTVARTVFGMIMFQVIAGLVGQTFRQILAPLAKPMLAAMILGVCVYGCRLVLEGRGMHGPLLLATLVCLGGLIWLALLLRFFAKLLDEMLQVVDLFSTGLGVKVRRAMEPLRA